MTIKHNSTEFSFISVCVCVCVYYRVNHSVPFRSGNWLQKHTFFSLPFSSSFHRAKRVCKSLYVFVIIHNVLMLPMTDTSCQRGAKEHSNFKTVPLFRFVDVNHLRFQFYLITRAPNERNRYDELCVWQELRLNFH